MMSELNVIFGTGPVGCWIARSLNERNIPTRAINRSGQRPVLMPIEVEVIAADASDARQAIEVAQGAAVVYQAMNPPYHRWGSEFPGLQAGALAAAKAAEARYVSIENLYMYDSSGVITEDSPIHPRSKKGELRTKMGQEVMEAHERGDVVAAILRSSDYYGPGVLGSALGEMVFGNLVKGKVPQVSGSAHQPHSFAYIEDVAAAAVMLGTRDEAPGKVWIAPHAPALTQGEMVELACQLAGVEPQVSVISPLMMRLAGLFVPEARASVEMMYEFTEPFVVDSSKFESTFGLGATSMETGLIGTIDWYKASNGTGTGAGSGLI